MTSMTHQLPEVICGVDTHGQSHHGALIDTVGRHLADRQFPATAAGYQDLIGWMTSMGQVVAVGVEGTGSYGAGLARALTSARITVIEVDRPDRKARRLQGKSDPLDAYSAAMAVASQRAKATPKSRDGIIEAIRVLRIERRSAIKARTQASNQIRALITTAEPALREQMTPLKTAALITTLARLRPGPDLSKPTCALKVALRRLAKRYQHLSAEITDLDTELEHLTRQAAPALRQARGIGPQSAAALLISAGDNARRMRSEAAFAHLTGTAPIPASSGRTHRHRLNRGGDRAANHALHTIAIVRMRHDPRTRAYVQRRTQEGLSKKDILRCLKRYIAREVHHALNPTPTPPHHTPPTLKLTA